MNLPYTMTPDAAATWVKDFKPKVVYPYHYGDSDVKRFQTLVGNASSVKMLKWY
jgi:L-ascorbate metabolism protein UlaG (beta-lactamase superfamily)